MKRVVYGLAAGITAVMLTASPALAAPARPLDQYGCRWEAASNDYRCYRGAYAGQRFENRDQLVRVRVGSERLVPVYIDDGGAPRPMPPFAARGTELPPTDAGVWEYPIFPR